MTRATQPPSSPLPDGIEVRRNPKTGRWEWPRWGEPLEAAMVSMVWFVWAEILFALWLWGRVAGLWWALHDGARSIFRRRTVKPPAVVHGPGD